MTTLLSPVDDITAAEAASLTAAEAASLTAPSDVRALIPPPALYAVAAAAVCGLWAAAIWTAGHLHTDPRLHKVALFAHLAFLLIGFGAILTLDWFGALWLPPHQGCCSTHSSTSSPGSNSPPFSSSRLTASTRTNSSPLSRPTSAGPVGDCCSEQR